MIQLFYEFRMGVTQIADCNAGKKIRICLTLIILTSILLIPDFPIP